MNNINDKSITLVEGCYAMYPNCSGQELLKYAVIELILDGTLELKKEVKRPNEYAPLTRYFSLKKGINFYSNKPNSYQNLIVNIFKGTDDLSLCEILVGKYTPN